MTGAIAAMLGGPDSGGGGGGSPLAVSASPTSVSASAETSTITTSTVNGSISGGTSPYSKQWDILSGSGISPVYPTRTSTAFQATGMSAGVTRNATAQLTVTDNVGTVKKGPVVSISISYPSGGGGTEPPPDLGCPWAEALVHTARGWIAAREVVPGDLVRVLADDRSALAWEPVESNDPASGECFTIISESGHEVTVSDSTPIVLRDGSLIRVAEIDGHELPVERGGEITWERCSVKPAGVLPVCHIRCNQKTYSAGNAEGGGILTHNPKP